MIIVLILFIAQMTMPKIVIHGAVLKGRHAYNFQVPVGSILDCLQEENNPVDQNAIAVRNDHGDLIGHIPKGVSGHFHYLLEIIPKDVSIFWLVWIAFAFI